MSIETMISHGHKTSKAIPVIVMSSLPPTASKFSISGESQIPPPLSQSLSGGVASQKPYAEQVHHDTGASFQSPTSSIVRVVLKSGTMHRTFSTSPNNTNNFGNSNCISTSTSNLSISGQKRMMSNSAYEQFNKTQKID
jgi:hypothetical protein